MCEPDQAITVAISPCIACGAGLLEGSNFCRSCGGRQLIQCGSTPAMRDTIKEVSAQTSCAENKTTRVSEPILYHPVSGPLVRAVATGVSAGSSHSPTREFSKRLLLALMAIPIWVMIILLSPLDAYASAKIIGNRI